MRQATSTTIIRQKFCFTKSQAQSHHHTIAIRISNINDGKDGDTTTLTAGIHTKISTSATVMVMVMAALVKIISNNVATTTATIMAVLNTMCNHGGAKEGTNSKDNHN